MPKSAKHKQKKKKRDENRRIYINGKQILLFLSRAKKITNCSVSMPSNQKKKEKQKNKTKKTVKSNQSNKRKGGNGEPN